MLNSEDIAVIKGMLIRGDRQSDIAAWFGVNGGRIAEINTRQKHGEVRAAPLHMLPPPGPYQVSVRGSMRAKQTLEALRDLIDQSLAEMNEWERGED